MNDYVLTVNDDGDLAIRTVPGTEDSNVTDTTSVITRTDDGKLAVRVVGSGGDSSNLGYFATLEALQEAYPTAEAGDWAIVGSTDTVWIWDTGTSAWVDSDQKGQVTSVNNQTGDVTIGINDILPDQTGHSGHVLGTDGFVAGWVAPEKVQRSVMPQASEDEEGNVYQFVGTTDANYTNGYFYKCVSDGQNPATYSWSNIQVQMSSGGLPSQTGNAGKFLTTDGTDASWSDTIYSLKIVNSSDSTKYTTLSSTGNLFIQEGTNWRRTQLVTHSSPNEICFILATSQTGVGSAIGSPTSIIDRVYTTKINNRGADIDVPKTGGTLALQIATMPTAGSTYEGVIYQFTGTTDSTYTNGHFYKCVSDGGNPATYSWVQTNVQPAGGGSSLPSQTGNSGKFLTTDGTDASWATVNALQNTATGTNSLTILGNSASATSGINIGNSSTALNGSTNAIAIGSSSGAFTQGVAIGLQANARGTSGVAIGTSAKTYNDAGIAIGSGAVAGDTNVGASSIWGMIALYGKATAMKSIQIGYGTNNDANTMKVGNNNGNFEIMSADGTIPTDRFTTTPSADGDYIPVVNLASGTATRSWSSIASALTTLPGYDATKTQTLKNIAGTLSWVDD